MTKVKILQTTMVAGQRHAKGDVAKVDEPTAQNLVALGKAETLAVNKDTDVRMVDADQSAKIKKRD